MVHLQVALGLFNCAHQLPVPRTSATPSVTARLPLSAPPLHRHQSPRPTLYTACGASQGQLPFRFPPSCSRLRCRSATPMLSLRTDEPTATIYAHCRRRPQASELHPSAVRPSSRRVVVQLDRRRFLTGHSFLREHSTITGCLRSSTGHVIASSSTATVHWSSMTQSSPPTTTRPSRRRFSTSADLRHRREAHSGEFLSSNSPKSVPRRTNVVLDLFHISISPPAGRIWSGKPPASPWRSSPVFWPWALRPSGLDRVAGPGYNATMGWRKCAVHFQLLFRLI
jgi:hypothetical protein